MTVARFEELIRATCEQVGIYDVETVIERRSMEVDNFEITLGHFDSDADALYVMFNFGVVTAGRSLRVYRLLLEANLTIYAQDQAQLGLCQDTGSILLIVRTPMSEDVDGVWLADTLAHYSEHGRYWRSSIIESTDEMFDGLSNGEYHWIKT